VGQLKMRWLSCPCESCLNKRWDECYNVEFLGGWCDREQTETGTAGQGEPRRQRREEFTTYARDMQVGQIIAVFTQVDLIGARFWVAKVATKPRKLQEPEECPISGEKFDQGEVVFELTYYDRMPGEERIFRYRPELGKFLTRISMIRDIAVPLVPLTMRPRRGAAPTAEEQQRWELTLPGENAIVNRIVHFFQDLE
jgi:hypothetical protein